MSVVEKDYLPQYAAEAVSNLDVLKKHPEHSYVYGSIAELIRSAAHIVLPVNGNIYRDKDSVKAYTEEECASSGVMPHVVTTFEYPLDDNYFQDPESAVDEVNTPSAALIVVVDHKLASNYDREFYAKGSREQMETPYKRDPLTVIALARFGYGFYGPYAPREMRWSLNNYYISTLTPLYVRTVVDGVLCTDLNLIDVFTKVSAVTPEGVIKLDVDGVDPADVATACMSGLDSVVQACHSLRVGATLEARKEKSYTRSRTFEKKGVGGFEYHVLKLPTGTVRETLGSRVGSDRDGPKYHFRRAHLRTLSKGTQTFVRSCFVGNREKGTVEKEYKIPKEQA